MHCCVLPLIEYVRIYEAASAPAVLELLSCMSTLQSTDTMPLCEMQVQERKV